MAHRLALRALFTAGTTAALALAEGFVLAGVETAEQALALVARLFARSLARLFFRLPVVLFLVGRGGSRCVVERRVEIRLGFLDEARAELVSQRAAAHLDHLAFRQVAKLERAVGNADQAVDLETERAKHVLDFAVLAFAKTHGDPDIVALGAVERRVDAAVEHAVDGDALLQPVERRLIDVAMGAHAVAAQPAGCRQFEHARKAAVIGQQQQAFGVDVEAADRHDARQAFRQVVENGRAAFRIGVGGHQAGRLVVEPQAGALYAADRHAVDLDAVGQRGVDDGRLQKRAVQPHAAFGNHALDIAARGHAGAGEDF